VFFSGLSASELLHDNANLAHVNILPGDPLLELVLLNSLFTCFWGKLLKRDGKWITCAKRINYLISCGVGLSSLV